MIFDNGFINDYDLALKRKREEEFLAEMMQRRLRKGLVSPPYVHGTRVYGDRLVPASEELDEVVRLTGVVNADHLHLFFPNVGDYKDVIQPASLDVVVDRFYDSDGAKLSFPVKLEPNATVVCESDLEINLTKPVFSCLETRSSVARIGLAATGFLRNDDYEIFLKDYSGKIRALLTNFSPNTVVINGPRSFFQVTVSEHYEHYGRNYASKPWVSIQKNKRNVTEKSKVTVGNVFGYKLHLAPQVWCMKNEHHKVDFDKRKEAKDLFVRTRLDKVNIDDYGFCLTRSQETVMTSLSDRIRHPAYVFPFHFDDIHGELNNKMAGLGSLKEVFKQVFLDKNSRCSPITGNAGLCNPGWTGSVTFENICINSEWASRFKVGEPFALLIPLPFVASEKNTYNGSYNNQKQIGL